MIKTIQVEIDEGGGIYPIQANVKLPPGRAFLILPVPEAAIGLIMSESSLAKDWLNTDEDGAWAHLQG